MDTKKHTQGEWVIDVPNRMGFAICGIGPKDGFIICDICNDGYGEEEQLANAKLIAAAPELLEALERFTRLSMQKYPEMIGWINEAQKAIKKATE